MFMYLHLLRTERFGLVAKLTNDGLTSLGSTSSRYSYSPIGVFQIDSFEGLECVADDDLLAECRQRFSREDLLRELAPDMDFDELVNALKRKAGK